MKPKIPIISMPLFSQIVDYARSNNVTYSYTPSSLEEAAGDVMDGAYEIVVQDGRFKEFRIFEEMRQ